MKKIILLFTLLSCTCQFSHAQNKKGGSKTTKTISGVDLDDYSSDYDGKTIRVYTQYQSLYNGSIDENVNLRSRDKDTEKVNSLYNHGITEDMSSTVGSNVDYFSRQVELFAAGSKIRIRIPYKINTQIPNISSIGNIYVTGKWHARSRTLVVTKITR